MSAIWGWGRAYSRAVAVAGGVGLNFGQLYANASGEERISISFDLMLFALSGKHS
jgi:hypothetical protein